MITRMKQRSRIARLLLTVFLLSGMLSSFCVQAAGEELPIAGIDYSRITQRVGHGVQRLPVTLRLGELTFRGEMVGDIGLTQEELNQFVRQTLEEKGLTVERVALVAKIAARVQTDAKLYWADQTLEGLFSLLTIPGTPFSAGDAYAWQVHDNLAGSAAKSTAIFAAQKGGVKVLEKAAASSGITGKIAKGVLGTAESTGLGGTLVGTLLVAKDWAQGSQRFDDYLKLLEKNLAIINDFYAAVSRKAVAYTESKDQGSQWVIRFDKQKNKRTYKETFWGIPGNTMRCSLSGELKKESGDKKSVLGVYEGTLWMDFQAVDLSPVEKNLERTAGLAPVMSLLHSRGAYQKVFDSGDHAVLKREVQGDVMILVTDTYGNSKPEFTGSFNNGGDETTFDFGRHLIWEDHSMAALGAVGITDAWFLSDDVNLIYMESSSRVDQKGTTKVQEHGVETFSQDPGTIFRPLSETPRVYIDFTFYEE